MVFFASGLFVIDFLAKKGQLSAILEQTNHYIQHYFGGTLEHLKHGQIIFSSDCTAKKLVQQSTMQLPYTLDLDSNIITISQFVNHPAKFEFRDKKLGFTLEQASWGNFKFKGDTQEFIELSIITTPEAIKIEDGVQAIKEIVQKLESAGWKPAAGFEKSLTPFENQNIEKRIQWDHKRTSAGPKLMAWQSKEYQVNLHAVVSPEKDRENKTELKMSVQLCIKKI